MSTATHQGASSKKYRRFSDNFIQELEKIYLISKKVFTAQKYQQRKHKKVPSGIEFADYRNYSPGDDMRTLDWRIYARTEKLLLRLFEEKEELDIHILVDISASMQHQKPPSSTDVALSKLDLATQIAATLAYIALRNMDNVAVHAFHTTFMRGLGPFHSRGQIFKIFDYLDNLDPDGQTQLNDALREFTVQAKRSKRRKLVVVISDFYDLEPVDTCLKRLHYAQCDTHVIHIIDPNEMAIFANGDFQIIDCESGSGIDVTLTPTLLEAYRKEQQQFGIEVAASCARRGMLYCPAQLDHHFEDIILGLFRAGGFVS